MVNMEQAEPIFARLKGISIDKGFLFRPLVDRIMTIEKIELFISLFTQLQNLLFFSTAATGKDHYVINRLRGGVSEKIKTHNVLERLYGYFSYRFYVYVVSLFKL